MYLDLYEDARRRREMRVLLDVRRHVSLIEVVRSEEVLGVQLDVAYEEVTAVAADDVVRVHRRMDDVLRRDGTSKDNFND